MVTKAMLELARVRQIWVRNEAELFRVEEAAVPERSSVLPVRTGRCFERRRNRAGAAASGPCCCCWAHQPRSPPPPRSSQLRPPAGDQLLPPCLCCCCGWWHSSRRGCGPVGSGFDSVNYCSWPADGDTTCFAWNRKKKPISFQGERRWQSNIERARQA